MKALTMAQVGLGISCLLVGASWCWNIDVKHLLAWVLGAVLLLLPLAGVEKAWKSKTSSTTPPTTIRPYQPGRGVRAARRR